MVAGKNRTLVVDTNLPRWVCQNCHHSLSVDSCPDKFLRSGMQGSSMHGTGSVHGTRMDQSYVVLPKQRNIPPRPNQSGKGRAMEESFVVLPPPAASVYKSEPTSNNSGFHSTITVLKRACEIATTQTHVEKPLCVECMSVLSSELDKEVEDVNRDIKAYEACLQRLEGEPRNMMLSEADFLREKLTIEEEERKLEAAIKETEKQCSEVTSELKELEIKSNRFKELEERYWHEFNNFQFRLISHQEKRDALLAKTEVSEAQFKLLKKTNVLKDAFPISCEGEFGTINTFRLGRLPKIEITWEEINAAWGQACLLLDAMAQHFTPKFQYRIKILPMGSYPRIRDSDNNTYKLFGPVNKFWSTQYDKAMTLFLACLKDFAEFANNEDKENNVPLEECIKLPYKIEVDKVGSYSIMQSFNKQENWTKALKYTLTNLKWALYWFDAKTTPIED